MLFSDTPHIANYNSTIFKTINGDFKLFNQTLVSTNGNISKSASGMSKLSTAFERYNSLSAKSASFQKVYNNALANNNTALGKYLSGLNGAKATMGGYIKSLVSAKAATIGLQVASLALNTAITMGVSLAISALVSQITKWANAQKDARQKAIELTNTYKEQKNSLDGQIKKYKELKEILDKGNLSTDESRSIKEQLLEIQNSLIESYGDEASNIDLVNGKYREQLSLLDSLSKEKATEHVTENRDVFADAKEALEKERTYNLGTVTSWNTYSPQTEDQKKLLDYIEAYSELLDLTDTRTSGHGVTATSVSVSVKADVTSADELMHQFATDLEKYGEENDIDVSGILEGISGQLKETWTDELTEYKTVYDEFMKAEIVRNDTLRPLYQESIQAVEDYNKALSTGEGIEEAKANLESVQQSVQSATGELEGSQSVFDGIYEGINKDAEAIYDLDKVFENDKTVQNYAEQLRGLTDVDLKAINFDNTNTEKGEESFKGLVETLGLTEEQVQSLIDKLVELEYAQGEVQGSTSDNVFKSFSDTEIGQRLQHATTLFNDGKISYKEYFDGLQTEIENVDFSHYTDSLEDAKNAAGQLFVDSTQQATQGLTNLINSFNSNEISVTEYLDGYLSIAETLGTLTDELQENSEAWDKNGEALSDSKNMNLDEVQSNLNSAIETVETYQDSIYGLEQILSGKLELGTDEFTAQTNVIAEDLANIVASGGEMSEEIKNYMGTSADEIAQSLTEDISNFDIASQAIASNTNVAIQNMATSIGELFEELGNAISNFKVDLSFGVSSITMQDVDMGILGTHQLPAVTFSLEASGDSLSSIGSAISSFGKNFSENMGQYIEYPDFTIEPEGDEYTPGDDVLNNYNNQMEKLKDASGKAGKDAGEEYREKLGKELNNLGDVISYVGDIIGDQIDNIQEQCDNAVEALESERDAIIANLEAEKEALQEQIDAKQDQIDKIREAREQRKAEIDLQKKQYDLERAQNQKTRLVKYVPDTIVI